MIQLSQSNIPACNVQIGIAHATANTAGVAFAPIEAIRCEQVRVGLRLGGHAQLAYISGSASNPVAFEDIFDAFGGEPLVEVRVAPPVDELTQPPQALTALPVIFQGVLTRRTIVAGETAGRVEGVRMTAYPVTKLDNDSLDHLIKGRWFIDPAEYVAGVPEAVRIATAATTQAVFNQGGRPNKQRDYIIATPSAGAPVINARVFTHEFDPRAEYWRVGDALASVLVMWLIGIDIAPLPRFCTVEDMTTDELNATAVSGYTPSEDRFRGLEEVLPETSVQGLGVFDAVGKICDAAGFDYAFDLVQDTDTNFTGHRYALRVWRRGYGRKVQLYIDKRGQEYASAQAFWAAQRDKSIQLMTDSGESVNEVVTRGRMFIEGRFPLRPMWSEEDMYMPTISAANQVSPTTEQLADDPYFSKYHPGGAQFALYGHVGRLWGIDCLGTFDDGYEPTEAEAWPPVDGLVEPYYAHNPEGFDFVDFLDLTNSGIADNLVALGINDPIRFMRRQRYPLPLRSADARLAGAQFYLEYELGPDWDEYVRVPVAFRVLRDQFAVWLDIDNLASVNGDTLGTGAVPDPVRSWMSDIQFQTLRFHLSCCIESDVGAQYEAKRRPAAASSHSRAELFDTDIAETWIVPLTAHNSTESWLRIDGYTISAIDGDQIDLVRSVAERRRDSLEDAGHSGFSVSPVLDPTRFQVGDVVDRIVGRNFPLASNSGNVERHPQIAAIDFTLYPGQSQQMKIALGDVLMVEGE